MTYQLNQKVIIKSLRRQGIIKEKYLAMIWRVELLNGTDKLCHESNLKPMPEKKEKCKHKRILHLGNMSNNTDYWKCVDCGKKVEKQSEPKGFKEEMYTKKRIIIPLEIELEVDEVVMGGKITGVTVHKKILTQEEVNKLFKEESYKF